MSKERELLQRCLDEFEYKGVACNELCIDINKLLAQSEPVAWMVEWVQRYRHNDTPIMDRAVSFTKGDAPAVPNPNYIPLYTALPKREPLSDEEIVNLWANKSPANEFECVRLVEKAHGIGGQNE
jgi:hypothetical protein